MAHFNRYESARESLDSPAAGAVAVTPHDTDALASYSRALYIGVTGDVAVKMVNGGNNITFTAVPAGTVLPVRASHVLATGTTATNIVALF